MEEVVESHPHRLPDQLLRQLPNEHRAGFNVDALMLKTHEYCPLWIIPAHCAGTNAWGIFQNLPYTRVHFTAVFGDLFNLQDI